MAVRALGGGGVLQARRGVPAAAALLLQLPFGLLLPAPLLLPQQLLGLQEDAGVDSAPPAARVSVPGALVARVARVVLRRLEDLAGRVRLVPRVLGDGAGVLPGLPDRKQETGSSGGGQIRLFFFIFNSVYFVKHYHNFLYFFLTKQFIFSPTKKVIICR